MGQLSKLCNNENNTDISFYQVYLQKLHKNICLQFVFGVVWSFVGLSPNCTTHIIIMKIAIWGIQRPDVRGGDVVTEIFSQPRLAFQSCCQM